MVFINPFMNLSEKKTFMWAWWHVLIVSGTQQTEAGGLLEPSLPSSLAGFYVFLCFSQSYFIFIFWASSDNHHILLKVRLDLHRWSSLWQTLELRTQVIMSKFENVLDLSFSWYQERQAFPPTVWSLTARSLDNSLTRTQLSLRRSYRPPTWLALRLPLTFVELTWSSQEVQPHIITLSCPDCGMQGDLLCFFTCWLPHAH